MQSSPCSSRACVFALFAWFGASPLLAQDFGDGSAGEALGDLDLGDLDAGAPGEDSDEENGFWTLGFDFQVLRLFTPARGAGKGRVHWYMIYTIENNTGEDREFYLSIGARSDREKTYRDLFLPLVEREIEGKLGRKLWGQDDRFEILREKDPSDTKYNYTTIKAGEKRSCIAVFNPLDPNANNITVEIYGLTNDVEAVKEDDGSTVLREKVRVLQFKRRGDEYEIDQDPVKLEDRGWVKKDSRLPASSS